MLRAVAEEAIPNPMLTREECAALLGVTVWQVRTWTENGMPCYRSGESVRYHRAEVEDWWRSGRRTGADALGAQLATAVVAAFHQLAGEFDLTISVRRRGQ